jgi:hypothetical protein
LYCLVTVLSSTNCCTSAQHSVKMDIDIADLVGLQC